MFEPFDVFQLGEAFQIVVDVALCGRIGGGCTQSFRACYAADDGNLCFPLRPFGIIIEHRRYHSCEAEGIGLYGPEFLVKVEFWILISDA